MLDTPGAAGFLWLFFCYSFFFVMHTLFSVFTISGEYQPVIPLYNRITAIIIIIGQRSVYL